MPAPLPPIPEAQDPPGSFLFADEIIREITDEERRFGRYTAERMPKQKRDAVIQLLAERRPVYEIARLVQVARESVTAVADHAEFGAEVARRMVDERGMLARKFRRCTHSQLDRLERFPDLLPASQIPLASKLWVEEAELLEGRATSRTEHTDRVDIFADYPAFLAELEQQYDKKTGPGNGLPAGKFPQLDAGAADPGAVIDVPAESPADPGNDSHSSDCAPVAQADPESVTANATDSPAGSLPPAVQDPDPDPAVPTPPGGGQTPQLRRHATTDNEPQNFWPNGSFEGDVEE